MKNLKYSIILTIEGSEKPDVPEAGDWDITEDEENYEDTELYHIKCLSILNQEQFDELIEETGLEYDCESMGSVGAPGFGICLVPAVSFISYNQMPNVFEYYDYHANVTPFNPDKTLDWEDILEFIKQNY